MASTKKSEPLWQLSTLVGRLKINAASVERKDHSCLPQVPLHEGSEAVPQLE